MKNPDISIIIPTFNRRDILKRTIQNYIDKADSINLEILVVDDGSTDETLLILKDIKQKHPEIFNYFHQKNKGPAAARNLAIKNASGKLILITGDDIIPSENMLLEHLEFHKKYHSNEVAVLGKVTWSRELEINSFMRWLESSGMQFHFDADYDPENLPPQLFYTSNISIKKDYLLLHELFDEKFNKACWEDVDLGIRLSKYGLKIIYNPNALGYHNHPIDFANYINRTETAGYYHAFLCKKHNIKMPPRIFILELLKWTIGNLFRSLPIPYIQGYGYRWSLSWYEYKGIQKFIKELHG